MRIRKQGHTILGMASSMLSTSPPPPSQLWVVPSTPPPPPPQLWVVPSLSTELPEAVLVCKLNQSPWDVVTYPPTPPRPDPEERPSYSKLDMEAIERDGSAMKMTGDKKDKEKVSIDKNDTIGNGAVGATAICKKTDGKKWKCKQSAAYPGSFCHYHLVQLQSYSSTGSNKGNVKAPATIRKKRAAMAAVSLGSDMNDFYYYSVFGPGRGKRRGSHNDNSSTTEANEDGEKAELEEEIVSWEFDNMDDSTDEEDKGKKKKPVKARSLKSLFQR